MIRLLASCAVALGSLPAYSEPATARYAGAQLGVAQAELRLAREAMARGDALRAERLAVVASVDARLAWSMSESHALRRAATQVHRSAFALRQSMRVASQ